MGDVQWSFANNILYNMCKENPDHTDRDVAIGKMLIIGRTYAAAIERRIANDNMSGDDFYYEKVAPMLVECNEWLDPGLESLRNNGLSIRECKDDILKLHSKLMREIFKITDLNKRSLVSKYLHFHCPDKFFIFDERARVAINRMGYDGIKIDKEFVSNLEEEDYDEIYADFVCKMLKLQEERGGASPRELDNYLLRYIK